jgi:O6-methylguanine-DNA--protein-cysteine methyltransferase
MTIPVTELGNSFDQWRVNTNQNGVDIGDTSTLVTQANNLTDAINETQSVAQAVNDNSIAMSIALGG